MMINIAEYAQGMARVSQAIQSLNENLLSDDEIDKLDDKVLHTLLAYMDLTEALMEMFRFVAMELGMPDVPSIDALMGRGGDKRDAFDTDYGFRYIP